MPKKTFRIALVCWTIFITTLSFVRLSGLKKIDIVDGDKYVHFIFYFVLTGLLFLNLNYSTKKYAVRCMLSCLIAVVYGIIIEVLQGTLTKTRQFELLDIAANTSGSIAALVCLFFLSKWLKFQKYL